ncbi:N-acetylglucosamine-6-phosphate deacetylase [Paracoccus caeni]|uniref:N-acetylglucosamine-6-phosphate deacetylase n=1 Tax=Paracoccus caeni TaxID=657651 RepID=A0A934VZW5_9RHOB|nr:N-acetylglucosamine-6-phosphate deacetylase [Paracoccus caeni]MBK4216285.1 N-acetylglucosamine-6-phosphate deacetylase [Paracoccus caeni]
MPQILTGARIFDGQRLISGHALVIEDGVIRSIIPADSAPAGSQRVEGIIAPGFVDLQVNGGGGVMVDGATDLHALRHICATHLRLGCAGILPTLISDTPEATRQVIAAAYAAAWTGVPGFLGLHLEGPHLDPRRHGAHDPAVLRPMTSEDLDLLCDAARALPVLMVTLAPEAATPEQIATLVGAGAVVSLGHSDCDFDTASAAYAAGAGCTTHLFNAMSQMGHRQPGLVGAALTESRAIGLIADAVHVHPAAMRIALSARSEGVFLVSDCMAFAGTDLTEMPLNGRLMYRQNGRLTLADGTLAGADLRLDRALQVLVGEVGIPAERALAMATSEPARAIGLDDRYGHIIPGRHADMILLDDRLTLQSVWQYDEWQPALQQNAAL